MEEMDRSDRYVLPRNDAERERLGRLHKLLTEVLDGRLILDENVTLGPSSRVLDSATGAASWTLDLVRATEGNFEVVGIDLSSAMFPKDVPSNVKLYEYSVLDLPKEWENSFDLVNQRLLLAALTESQWLEALSELFRVLKPGGAIQLLELGYLESPHDWSLLPATKKIVDITDTVFQKRGVLGWAVCGRLPTLLEQAGFSEIYVENHHAPLGKQWGELGVGFSEDYTLAGREVALVCMQEGWGGVDSIAELDAFVEKAKRERDDYPGLFRHMSVFIARKPSLAV